jgi:hypothetical protein
MPKFSVVFVAPSEVNEIKHRIISAADQESAMKIFFNEEATAYYSDDDQGFFYFKQDFFDKASPSGSVLGCD